MYSRICTRVMVEGGVQNVRGRSLGYFVAYYGSRSFLSEWIRYPPSNNPILVQTPSNIGGHCECNVPQSFNEPRKPTRPIF